MERLESGTDEPDPRGVHALQLAWWPPELHRVFLELPPFEVVEVDLLEVVVVLAAMVVVVVEVVDTVVIVASWLSLAS